VGIVAALLFLGQLGVGRKNFPEVLAYFQRSRWRRKPERLVVDADLAGEECESVGLPNDKCGRNCAGIRETSLRREGNSDHLQHGFPAHRRLRNGD